MLNEQNPAAPRAIVREDPKVPTYNGPSMHCGDIQWLLWVGGREDASNPVHGVSQSSKGGQQKLSRSGLSWLHVESKPFK